jgi:hypothetical protein
MIAFHNQEEIKTKYLDRVRKHREMDELVKGRLLGGKTKRKCLICVSRTSRYHYEKRKSAQK